MAANIPMTNSPIPTCRGVAASPVAMEAAPMPVKKTTIIPSRCHLSASHPAGSENSPNARKPGVA